MSTHERDHLCRMLEQIAANFAWDGDAAAAAAVAAHLQRFWSAEMRRIVIAAVARGEVEVSPLAARALHSLEPG